MVPRDHTPWVSGPPGNTLYPTVAPTCNWAPKAIVARPRPPVADRRSVVITGASRGLGFASAVRLYREGWQVVAAMRTPERGMALLRDATGAAEDDDRLLGVKLD